MMFGVFEIYGNPCFVTETIENVMKTITNIVVDKGTITNKLIVTVMSLSTRTIGGYHQRGGSRYLLIYNEVNSRQEIIGVYHIKEKIISMSIHLKTTPRLYMKFSNYVKCKISINTYKFTRICQSKIITLLKYCFDFTLNLRQ